MALLRQFVLVFFDDILVYNKLLSDNVQHLTVVLETLSAHPLFVKRSKCSFASRRVEYLGNFINEEGVSTDPKKVEAVHGLF